MSHDPWRGLFEGEFASRQKILSNLTLEQVNAKPGAVLHSIYEELWHLVLWQNILVDRNEALYKTLWQTGQRYPSEPAKDEEAWTALVEDFFSGSARALTWTDSPERLALETDPGSTMADVLRSLAVHNAYHFGKIVALRQTLGCWQSG